MIRKAEKVRKTAKKVFCVSSGRQGDKKPRWLTEERQDCWDARSTATKEMAKQRLSECYVKLDTKKRTCIDWLGGEIQLEKMCRVIKDRNGNVLITVEKVEGVL